MNPIVAEVERRGRLTFRDFMELALYHPEAGYYTRPRRRRCSVAPPPG
jgi:SAM-dependent MidA family methyltransferase